MQITLHNILFQELENTEGEQGAQIEYDSDFFEEPPPYDENASFYMMNLSRPILKAIGALNYVHPTPIQAATIPVALLGQKHYLLSQNITRFYFKYVKYLHVQ